ncbi:hypothetical protein [Flavisolibacter nicotianae]|uniref:hypothetical protein n=1 Tax=Flavisolibacter nicotianae TaxID=2364882 RepID=UPI001968BB3A|nr:hypothetical protein [Flavisolibacter nicotianae]
MLRMLCRSKSILGRIFTRSQNKLQAPANRHKRIDTYHARDKSEGRWRKFSKEEIIPRDRTSLDITWLKDKSLADLDNLPDPDVPAEKIAKNLERALGSFQEIIAQLKK